MAYYSRFRIGQAVICLKQGGVIAHPTDTIYGLACLPKYHQAAQKILALKNREIDKGLLLLSSDICYIKSYISLKHRHYLEKITKTNTPTTYLLPTNNTALSYMRGCFNTVAVRITPHPLIKTLCSSTKSALLSSSANIHGFRCAKSIVKLHVYFAGQLDYILAPAYQNQAHPSSIKNILTGEIIR